MLVHSTLVKVCGHVCSTGGATEAAYKCGSIRVQYLSVYNAMRYVSIYVQNNGRGRREACCQDHSRKSLT